MCTFEKNLNKVTNHNAKFYANQSTFLMRVNHRSDETKTEKSNWFSLRMPEVTNCTRNDGFFGRNFEANDELESKKKIKYPPAPDSLDWRDFGVVTEVEDQGLGTYKHYLLQFHLIFQALHVEVATALPRHVRWKVK